MGGQTQNLGRVLEAQELYQEAVRLTDEAPALADHNLAVSAVSPVALTSDVHPGWCGRGGVESPRGHPQGLSLTHSPTPTLTRPRRSSITFDPNCM